MLLGLTNIQVVFGQIPYPEEKSDSLVCLAMDKKKLPAEIAQLLLPSELAMLVGRCWQWVPEQRPDARLCIDILSGYIYA